MKLADFDYFLPKELIAQYPLEKRDSARLLVVDRKRQTIGHTVFTDITAYFKTGDLLVLNDTKVLPCRLLGKRPTGGKAEVLLLKQKAGTTFQAFIKPARVKLGEKILFNSGEICAEVTGRDEIGFSRVTLSEIYAHGVMPLPPYIKRMPEDSDREDYQTVYAREEGSVASPTAGLHFTRELLEKIKASGVEVASITLHVGLGTFKPVQAEDVRLHQMEPEYFSVGKTAAGLIAKAKEDHSRVFAVGTTSCRALEQFAAGKVEGNTDLFIYPGYAFKLVDCLLTNFHLPRTTLFMLVCAFAGEKLAKQAYQEAIERKYRFYSYGDAMLII